MSRSILAIVGPTASGKTTLALTVAKEKNGELISADSRQIYQGLSVGTAKPAGSWTPSDAGGTHYAVDGILHHLVDCVSPDQAFSAAEFSRRAAVIVHAIFARGRVPIFVGGTGFYLAAFEKGLSPLPSANPTIREKLRRIAEERGRSYLHAQLAHVDAESAGKIPANNWHRVIRALEVFELSGRPLSEWHRVENSRPRPRPFTLDYQGIDIDFSELEKRIAARCHAMLRGGMIEETQALLARGFASNCFGLSALGYPRVIDYLEKRIDREQLAAQLILETRQYAKRQMTWFRHQAGVVWKK